MREHIQFLFVSHPVHLRLLLLLLEYSEHTYVLLIQNLRCSTLRVPNIDVMGHD